MRFTVSIALAAQRDLKRIRGRPFEQIAAAIDALADNPRPPGTKKLEGAEDLYRIRVGDCRILYRVENRQLTVLIVRIGHRGDVYRKGD